MAHSWWLHHTQTNTHTHPRPSWHTHAHTRRLYTILGRRGGGGSSSTSHVIQYQSLLSSGNLQTPQNVNPHGRVDEVLIDSRALQATEHYVIQCSVLQTNYKLSHAMRGKSYENIGKQTVPSCTKNTGTFQIVSSEHVQYTNNSNNACLTFHILYVAIIV